MAGFFCQALRLVVGLLRVVPRTFELLLPGFDTRKHGVEGFSQAADFIVVAPFGPQRVVFLAGHLARQLFELIDRLGDQAPNLPGDD